MKTIIFVILLMVSLNSPAQESFNFRKSNWGMNADEVKSSEKSKLLTENKGMLVYSDTVANVPCQVFYYFNNEGKLYRSGYIFINNYDNPSNYIAEYNKFKGFLIKKYGKPESNKEMWSVSDINKEASHWGPAIAHGDLSLETTWITPETICKQSLTSNANLKVYVQIDYTSKKIIEVENKLKTKEILDKL